MTGQGHNWAGVALIPSVYYETYANFNNHVISFIACLCLLSGATAPDWLEIRKKSGGTVINHRTITHWLPLWIGLFAFANYMMNNEQLNLLGLEIASNQYIASSLLGFAIGGLLHLAVDFPNPMGIPVFTPYHRLSLNLWKSGKNESLVISVVALFSFFYIGLDAEIVEIHYDKILPLLGLN